MEDDQLARRFQLEKFRRMTCSLCGAMTSGEMAMASRRAFLHWNDPAGFHRCPANQTAL